MPPATDIIGTLLDGRYRLTSLMGEGGMGRVYEGVHEQLASKIAVKVLLPQFAYETKFRERFLREARATSKIRHPNIVQLLDFGPTPNGSVYFAMEFLEGRDLSSLLREEQRLSWPRARHLLLQMTSALGAAHQHGIIHRDVKPGNFFITNAFGHEEFIKVLDFGIAKLKGATGGDRTQAQNLTGTGEIFGTAKYMAPEQAFGESDDLRVDVYSLGIVAYEMLTGGVPFTGSSAFEIITRHVNDPPRAPRTIDPRIPAAAEQVILRAIAKRPDRRFSSMDEMRVALADIPEDGGTMSYATMPRSGGPRPSNSSSPPAVRLKARPLGAHSRPMGDVSSDPLARDDSDSLRLKAYAPVSLGGTPMSVPLPANPFKSVDGSPEVAEPEGEYNPFKSVATEDASSARPGPDAGGGSALTALVASRETLGDLNAQRTALVPRDEMAAFDPLRTRSEVRSDRPGPPGSSSPPSSLRRSTSRVAPGPATPRLKKPATPPSPRRIAPSGPPIAPRPASRRPPAPPAPPTVGPRDRVVPVVDETQASPAPPLVDPTETPSPAAAPSSPSASGYGAVMPPLFGERTEIHSDPSLPLVSLEEIPQPVPVVAPEPDRAEVAVTSAPSRPWRMGGPVAFAVVVILVGMAAWLMQG